MNVDDDRRSATACSRDASSGRRLHMTSSAMKVGMGVALVVTVGGIAARSARGDSGIANVALPPVTVPCPALGHTSAPDANGWTTQFPSAPSQGTTAAQVNTA